MPQNTSASDHTSALSCRNWWTVAWFAAVPAGMGWNFEAPALIEIALGETALVVYKARHQTNRPVLGTATYNVVPFQAGQYFDKIQCFCFTEQLLMRGEEKAFPVSFYVDPALAADRGLKDTSSITLSYSFFDKGPRALQRRLASGSTAAAPAKRNADRLGVITGCTRRRFRSQSSPTGRKANLDYRKTLFRVAALSWHTDPALSESEIAKALDLPLTGRRRLIVQ
ncbi:cytochrome c oxidase assembly protein [Microvirga sp. VF16]|uniref:cytochrome c oxidase assembly protein n=1 Tax=Microvirga sp. VF16 TaxID=2807101 RepID=UPI00193DAF0D|nr:cytochrome c oxidase assembly protein [Microvirga sp. VF16]QRM35295.1 cytochrome c oxidase assembly protein [Microvirga sp. VF16]